MINSYIYIAGLRVSNSTFNAIVMRYSDKEGHVRFDDFVACVIKLKTMFGRQILSKENCIALCNLKLEMSFLLRWNDVE